ncbi:peptidase inhibitor R3HDML [Rhinatrema bivittatum]|uniref:peptidase inhibitor R3HDML n=1 Tax=Rhinatrema bivittatum TaxID=194408 RepID=UPI00112DA2B9|nr:peptidase inhibitor R3HDML [Rhinatrema bivittatum]
MLLLHVYLHFAGAVFWTVQLSHSFALPNATELLPSSRGAEADLAFGPGIPKSRRKRYISLGDMSAILDYHNQARSQVIPSAANMEYMMWDEGLARSAESWAAQCIWDHGPAQLLRYVGQNLALHSGRYRSIISLVQSWYNERQYYSFPYPQECYPSCPNKCSGSICGHYTQMVWASSNRIGCAVNTCKNIKMPGSTRRRAILLVCNYSIKGNWIGEAPYKLGVPCSACPPSYGGVCSNKLCFSGFKSNSLRWL